MSGCVNTYKDQNHSMVFPMSVYGSESWTVKKQKKYCHFWTLLLAKISENITLGCLSGRSHWLRLRSCIGQENRSNNELRSTSTSWKDLMGYEKSPISLQINSFQILYELWRERSFLYIVYPGIILVPSHNFLNSITV